MRSSHSHGSRSHSSRSRSSSRSHSSMSHSHSSFSHSHSRMSHSHGSISHRNHAHSSLHSRLNSRRSSSSSLKSHSSLFKHHGISNAHAFSVGRATGININGSAMGAQGSALHRSSARRSRINRRNSIKRNIRLSQNNKRFTLNITDFEDMNELELNSKYQKLLWIPMIMFFIIFFIMMGYTLYFMSKIRMGFM